MLISAPGLISGIRLGRNANVVATNCNISTTTSQFGASSLRNIGTTGTYANITPITGFAFGTGNFTIEFWYYPTATTQQGLLGFRPGSTNGAYPAIVGNYFGTVGTNGGAQARGFSYYTNSSLRISAANVLTANTWQNIAVVRNNGNTAAYINGSQVGNIYVDSTNYQASRCILAADEYTVGGTALNGYIDELRISNVARYTGNYTVATQPFIDDANTLLLYHLDQGNGSRNLVDDNS